MLIFYKARLVVLSVPKTGSTALEAALSPHADMVIRNPPELKHAPVFRYNNRIRPLFEQVCGVEMELAAVMREPLDWLRSWYRFRRRPDLEGAPTSTRDISFDEFVRDYCRGKQPPHAQIGSQAKFLEPQRNGCQVHHLFAYERLDRFHDFLRARTGIAFSTEQMNVSPLLDTPLSAQTEAVLRRKCAAEFALYHSITQD